MGRYKEAVAAIKRTPLLRIPHRVLLAACYLHMGEAEQARAETAEILQQNPALTVSSICKTLFYENDADLANMRAALIAAGLPE